jgi:hypothetical protein
MEAVGELAAQTIDFVVVANSRGVVDHVHLCADEA